MKKVSVNEPTPAELDILHLLWDKGSLTVREVNEALNDRRKIQYTTTLKTMQIMTEKGMLQRDERGRSHIYFPVVREKEAQQALFDKFLGTTFRGSAMSMVMHALGNYRVSKKEADEIKDLLNGLDGGQK